MVILPLGGVIADACCQRPVEINTPFRVLISFTLGRVGEEKVNAGIESTPILHLPLLAKALPLLLG
jgi:hypothetical protein